MIIFIVSGTRQRIIGISWHTIPAKAQSGSREITDLSKMLMSAFILKYRKMLLISHFDKTVIKIIITTKGPPADTWMKNLNILGVKLRQLNGVKWVLVMGNLRTLSSTLRKTIECLENDASMTHHL